MIPLRILLFSLALCSCSPRGACYPNLSYRAVLLADGQYAAQYCNVVVWHMSSYGERADKREIVKFVSDENAPVSAAAATVVKQVYP